MKQYLVSEAMCIKTVSISNFMYFIVKIILLKMQVPKDAKFLKLCSCV